jgi:hypothetical protein
METLIRWRPFAITSSFTALVGIGIGAYFDRHPLLVAAAIIAHVSLFLFTATESFGRIAQGRSKSVRILARGLFSMYVMGIVGLLATWVTGIANA